MYTYKYTHLYLERECVCQAQILRRSQALVSSLPSSFLPSRRCAALRPLDARPSPCALNKWRPGLARGRLSGCSVPPSPPWAAVGPCPWRFSPPVLACLFPFSSLFFDRCHLRAVAMVVAVCLLQSVLALSFFPLSLSPAVIWLSWREL